LPAFSTLQDLGLEVGSCNEAEQTIDVVAFFADDDDDDEDEKKEEGLHQPLTLSRSILVNKCL